ncbi:MAG: hypothetical protein GF341_11510 [candidate division Zixibacteria bacterium]|nr:hypothetical protein [candidate division Zixibacteria bacterium]
MIRHHRIAKTTVCFFVVIGLVAVGASPASALMAGPRAGVSFEPDQVVLGAQGKAGLLTKGVGFVPGIEFGLGNDQTVVSINGDFQVNLPNLPNTNVSFYALGGPTVSYFSPDNGDSDTEIGISLGAGMRVPIRAESSYYIESRFGIGDIPDLKLIVGALFSL